MLTDDLQTFAGYSSSTGDVLQERDDVRRPLRSAEGQEQQRVDRLFVDEGAHMISLVLTGPVHSAVTCS
jgi:hypothetical protein